MQRNLQRARPSFFERIRKHLKHSVPIATLSEDHREFWSIPSWIESNNSAGLSYGPLGSKSPSLFRPKSSHNTSQRLKITRKHKTCLFSKHDRMQLRCCVLNCKSWNVRRKRRKQDVGWKKKLERRWKVFNWLLKFKLLSWTADSPPCALFSTVRALSRSFWFLVAKRITTRCKKVSFLSIQTAGKFLKTARIASQVSIRWVRRGFMSPEVLESAKKRQNFVDNFSNCLRSWFIYEI